MSENTMHKGHVAIFTAAKMVLEKLNDDELVGLQLCVALDTDPRQASWWDRAEPMFTGKKVGGAPLMHDIVRRAVSQEVVDRGL